MVSNQGTPDSMSTFDMNTSNPCNTFGNKPRIAFAISRLRSPDQLMKTFIVANLRQAPIAKVYQPGEPRLARIPPAAAAIDRCATACGRMCPHVHGPAKRPGSALPTNVERCRCAGGRTG